MNYFSKDNFNENLYNSSKSNQEENRLIPYPPLAQNDTTDSYSMPTASEPYDHPQTRQEEARMNKDFEQQILADLNNFFDSYQWYQAR